ncbi:MAG: ribonuclease HI [Betaproteobacteria bacterium]
MEQIEIYTDGACKGNPGPGGWGALLRSGEHEKEIFGGERHTTNNRMEITAVIESLKLVKKKAKVCIYTDSTYVKDGISSWIKQWKINGWKTAAKKPVKNEELWRELDLLVSQHQIEWVWVKGHAGDEGNERADALANKGVTTVS